jgi:acyl-CoA synthetase (AMP-forming)/AMP-acid ligase II
VNCSEPVRAASHELFAETFRNCGLNPNALGASYAMAETTFAATQTPPGRQAPSVSARRLALAAGRFVPAEAGDDLRVCVSSGVPIAGCEVRIVNADGEGLPDGMIGEVWVRSKSLFSGYRNHADETRKALTGGWYHTGDLAFCWNSNLFVTGRLKDLIIVAGKNLYPEDIEDAVSAVDGVIPGRVAAFGIEDLRSGTEQICVLVETSAPDSTHRQIRTAILKAGLALDVTLGQVVLLPPRSLFKTSSGKICRKTNRERLLEGTLDVLSGAKASASMGPA